MRSNNPCWPYCPDETENKTCRPGCKRWKDYEKEKFAEYAAKIKQLSLEEDLNEYTKAATKRMKRGKRKSE